MKVWRKLLFFFRRSRFEEELSEEMQLHLDLRERKLGGDLDAAMAARRSFGNPAMLRDSSRDVWTWRWVEDLLLDVRFAIRMLRRKAGFAAIGVLTLALGIGASTAVFSVLDAVLLRPLPYRDSDRLVAIWDHSLRDPGLVKVFAPYPDYQEWSRRATSFESISVATWAFSPQRTLTGYGRAREALTIPVSATFFETLGVQAAVGRTFRPDDEGHGCEVVLSHKFWSTTLGRDPNIIGKGLDLDDKPCSVVGVMPAEFSFYPRAAAMWVLLGPDFDRKRDDMTVGIFARLKPGVTRARAEQEVKAMHRASHMSGFWHDFEPRVYDLHGEFTWLASRTLRTTLLVVFGAALFVLLIACVNVANLLLARLAERRREMAVRAALGSGKARLVRQVLTEGLMLALAGTAAGVCLAFAAVRYFRAASPIELTVGARVDVSMPVLLFAAGLSIATTLVFALVPALTSSRADVTTWLKNGGRSLGGSAAQSRTAGMLIVAEVSLSFVLLLGAGLFVGSALRMGSADLGFRSDNVVKTWFTLPKAKYGSPAEQLRFYDGLLQRLNGLPGVSGAAMAGRIPPYAFEGSNEALEIAGKPTAPENRHYEVGLNPVSTAFFDVLGISVLRGRPFGDGDRENTQPVAIVNEALVRRYFPKGDALGQHVRIARSEREQMPWLTIVGVAADVRHPELMNEMNWVASPVVYRPLSQALRGGVEVAVRAKAGAPPMEPRIQDTIAAMDARVPINEVTAVASEIGTILAYPRFRAAVVAFFAMAALILAAVGLHGVLSQIVAQRRAEFGIRKAVGAQARDLLVLVARKGAAPVAGGIGLGAAGTLAFGRVLAGLLYGAKPADARTLTIAAGVLFAVAAIAIALPARRAANVDPMAALREE